MAEVSIINNGEMSPVPEKVHPVKNIAFILNPFIYFFVGAITFISIFHASLLNAIGANQGFYKGHVYMCVIGTMILMTPAVLTWSPFNGWPNQVSNKWKTLGHGILQATGSLLVILGALLKIVDSTSILDKFTTAHGFVGIAGAVLAMFTLGREVEILFFKSKKHNKLYRLILEKDCLLSILTLIILYVSVCLGFDQASFRATVPVEVVNFSIALTVLALVGIVVGAVYNMANRWMA